MGGRGSVSTSGKKHRKLTIDDIKKMTLAQAADGYAAQEMKNYSNESFNSLALRIPDFVLDEKLSQYQKMAVRSSGVLSIERETEKAILIKAKTDNGELKFWSPKSVIRTPEQVYQERFKEKSNWYISQM